MRNFKTNLRFPILIISIVVLSFLQFFELSFFGVGPNFAIVSVVLAVLFAADFFEGIFLVSLAALILKFSPQPAKEIIILFVEAVAAVFFAKRLPWNTYVSFGIITTLFSIIFYFAVFPGFSFSTAFFLELGYNLILGEAAVFLLRQIKSFRE